MAKIDITSRKMNRVFMAGGLNFHIYGSFTMMVHNICSKFMPLFLKDTHNGLF